MGRLSGMRGSRMIGLTMCVTVNIFDPLKKFPARAPGENHRVPNPAPTPPATPSRVMGPPTNPQLKMSGSPVSSGGDSGARDSLSMGSVAGSACKSMI